MTRLFKLSLCPLFNDIDADTLTELESRVRWRHLLSEDVVCRKGDPSDGLFILLEGQLLVYDLLHNGQEVSLSVVTPGAFFGELSVIDLLPRTAFIKATQPSLVGLLPLEFAQAFFFTQPQLAKRVMEHLVGKVREMTIQRVLLGLPQAFQRVCAWLTHSKTLGADGAWGVRLVPKQSDLANMLNTSRETVSRSFARLVRDGVISKQGEAVLVLQADELDRLAQEDSPPLLNPPRQKSI
ncbi:Crp/Fnr family transcriptional regulator [Limnohabitans sp. WS1]|uniref:Crp/Fnr family transcriptional regulator n=1 Tax=Limnohabitans sp. WS1 TaxID=1100726 RepID=UPI0013049D8F|nr:Crp/Fnr family transcriptional regulator [Limnohabitans sp. WS1]